MPVVSRLFATLAVILLVACDPVARAPATPSAIVGTRAVIQRHGQELYAEVTAVTDKLVTTEYYWQDERVVVHNYYRGLYNVSGVEFGYQYEADFDYKLLEQLFPLAVGKEVSFRGNTKNINRGTAIDFWANIHVIGEKTISLSTGDRKVFVVDIVTEYKKGNQSKRKTNTVYYDSELSMVLKSVIHEDGYQSYWRAVSVELPGNARTPSPTQQRRAGTVMI
ncbi:PLP-dependent aminotransferase family protein [Kordiimonas aestuarii]|uniref:hypothetical protein n=1 Tax=Kordiimonas aestuarii TaxID=1005925 RepID=UPI0021D2FFA9|nr:hypothetical protein [Kordiimonas aestuarii]